MERRQVHAWVLFALLLYGPLFVVSVAFSTEHAGTVLINDISRLNPTYVKKIVKGEETQALLDALAEARARDLKVSIAGKRHSMGGHAFYPGALVLDMTGYDRVLALDPEAKTVTVQSGSTWKAVIEAANPHDLAVGVMQAYNGFSIGGSISVNVHESDPNYGPLVDTLVSFRLLLANGTILDVSRGSHPELFSLVVGGYGLFGVILDATIQLTDNSVLEKHERVIDYRDYLQTLNDERNDTDVGQIFARLSIARDDSLLREMVVTVYNVGDQDLAQHRALDDPGIVLKKLVFGLSRKYDWGKELRWSLQKEHSDLVDDPIISRNNLMNGDLAFLDYTSTRDTDILQEYFVPVRNLTPFIDRLRTVVEREDLNLLSATIRYLPPNDETILSYCPRESFGVVLYFNVGISRRSQQEVTTWTRELLDASLSLDGSYYLPYETYATGEQFRAAYSGAELFFQKKRDYDPNELFMSQFYEIYST